MLLISYLLKVLVSKGYAMGMGLTKWQGGRID